MNDTEAGRLANSNMLFVVALGLIVAALDVLKKTPLDIAFWISGLGIVALVMSFIFGGRGISRISSPRPFIQFAGSVLSSRISSSFYQLYLFT